MSVDVFGRQLIQEREIHRVPEGIGFTLTSEANFDIQNKRLCNVDAAIDPTDAVNLKSLDGLELKLREELKTLRESFGELKKKFETLKNTPKLKTDLGFEEQESILTNKT